MDAVAPLPPAGSSRSTPYSHCMYVCRYISEDDMWRLSVRTCSQRVFLSSFENELIVGVSAMSQTTFCI